MDDAAPASIAKIAFETGRIAERARIRVLLLELQADVPIDGPAYEAIDEALDKISEASHINREDSTK